MNKISHLLTEGGYETGYALVRTVDGDGDALGENVVVGALEGWDLSKAVELLVVVADTLGWLGVDNLEVELVGLGDSHDGSGAGVAL